MHVAVEGRSSFYHISAPGLIPARSQFSQPTLGPRYVSSPSPAKATDSLIPHVRNATIAEQPRALRYISNPQSIHELPLHSLATTPKEAFVPQPDGSRGTEEVYQRAVKLLPRSMMSAISESSSFRKILGYLTPPCWPDLSPQISKDNSNHTIVTKSYQVFEGINPEEHAAIAYLVRETVLFGKRPKLTYSPADGILILECPRPIHEMALTDLRDDLNGTVQSLDYDKYKVRAKVEMNLPFRSGQDGFTATPDLSLFLVSLTPLRVPPQIPILVECAFSQDRGALWKKLKMELRARPEVALVMAVIITEKPDFHSPQEDSTAWNLFSKEAECRDSTDFLSLENPPDSAASTESIRIEVAGHVWCNITQAEYYVWVKDGADDIDIDREEAYGTLYPSIDMDRVTQEIVRGMSKVKDCIVSFTQSLDPFTDTTTLQNAAVAFPVDWNLRQLSLVASAGLTAHDRYQDWYHAEFRGQKRSRSDDEGYEDNETGPDSESPGSCDATSSSDVTTSFDVTSPPPAVTPTLPTRRSTRVRKARRLDY